MRSLLATIAVALTVFDLESLPSIERNLRRMIEEKKAEVARTHDALADHEQHLAEGLHAMLTREDKARPFAKSGADELPSSFAELASDSDSDSDSDSEDPYVATQKEFRTVG